jgi:Adenylate cyclase, family 3 (some proteins contain HAMP domain)
MGRKFEYTTLAHRYTAQFPLLTYMGIQVNFWLIANLLLVTIMHLTSIMIGETFKVNVTGAFAPLVWIAVVLGISYGVILGLTHYYLDQKFFRKLALGKIIVFKAFISLGVLILILTLLRYVLSEVLISPTLPKDVVISEDESWDVIFWLLVIYYFFMTLLISFINQVNKKYGPGILLPLLLGQYREPKEEERIFMFMDLKSSTATAERLGHLKYSSFIRDCFSDINEVLYPFRAQVYQYVGDEIVVTWPEQEGIKNHFCITFYFACRRQFLTRSDYYMTNYGLLPDFKAGVHTGIVTMVEIGEVKRDIAYHGDTLNTAARIQSICNEYQKSFIASKVLLDKLGAHPNLQTQAIGEILLKGKTATVPLASVEWQEG